MFTFEVPSIDPALPPVSSPINISSFLGFYSLERELFISLSFSLAESDVCDDRKKKRWWEGLRTNKKIGRLLCVGFNLAERGSWASKFDIMIITHRHTLLDFAAAAAVVVVLV